MDCRIEKGETGNVLVIRIAVSDPAPLSKTGKTRLLASTHGTVAVSGDGIPEGCKVGLNVMVPAR